MSLSSLLVICPSIQQQLWDNLLNVPMAGGTVYFYSDDDDTTPKDVYELTGTGPGSYGYASLGSTLTLSSIGTFVDGSGKNIIPYLYPYKGLPSDTPPSNILELYYIRVYNSTGVFQFDIRAWPNIVSEGTINTASTSENILSNPQFVEVSFNPALTSANALLVSTSGTGIVTPIAPDWSIVTTGIGSFSVYQNPISDDTAGGNPAYALVINSSTGYSQNIILRQTITAPRILAGELVSGTFAIDALDGKVYTITMNYVPSSTGTPEIICSGLTSGTGWTTIFNSTAVLISPPNSGSTPSSYVNIEISIPVGAQVQISSVQLASVSSTLETVNFLEQTPARQKDHLFHYYENAVVMQPKSSILTGWNFGLNPWQFTSRNYTNVAANQYTADQTVIVQQAYVAAATANNVAVGSTAASGSPFQILAVTTTSQFAMIQYIDASTMNPYWNLKLSALVRATLYTVNNTTCRIKVRLITRTTAPSTISQTEPIASWTAGSDPTFAAGWTVIAPLNDPVYTLLSSIQTFTFNQFQLPVCSSGTQYLAIVVYTLDPLAIATSADVISIPEISLVRNDFALDAQPQTYDQVLRECQFYYEQTAPTLAQITGGSLNSPIACSMSTNTTLSSNNVYCYTTPWSVIFKNIKRKIPTITFYSVAGTINNVTTLLNYQQTGGSNPYVTAATEITYSTYFINTVAVASMWGEPITSGLSSPVIQTQTNGLSTSIYTSGGILFHYLADARIGLV